MNTPIEHALNAAKWIGRLAYLIAAIGTVASYGTQVTLLLTHDVGRFAYVIPATVDILAIGAAMALQLPNLDITSRKIAGATLSTAVMVSIAANVTGGHNTIARIAHGWPVVAYLLGELLANRVRAYAARLAAEQAAAKAAAKAAMAPVIPAPAPTPAPAPKPPAPAICTAGLRTLTVPAKPKPRPARKPRATATRAPYGPRNGEEYSERHTRRITAAAE